MAPTLEQLRNMTDAELEAEHDSNAWQYPTTVNYFLEELARRAAARRERLLIWLTVVITILTLANVVFVAWTVLFAR